MDMISKLPPGAILCLLPIQEAARTSILSREWRYHWIKIPKLAFIEDTFQVSTNEAELSVLERMFCIPSSRKQMTKRCKLLYAINQVLLMHEGPIHEFALCMELDDSCVELDHIILHLSKRNTVKILKLELYYDDYVLPLSLFSLHQLTDLYLEGGSLDQHLSFSGLGSLTTLYLEQIMMCDKTLRRLLSGCPLLKRLTLNEDGNINANPDSNIADLIQCLPAIEYLSVWGFITLCYGRLPKELPTNLVHLKYLCVEHACLTHCDGVPFLALLIRIAPNLEKLNLMFDNSWHEDYEPGSITLEGCSDIMLEHLKELEILEFSNTENELDFVKLILAKSSVLEMVRIFLDVGMAMDEELEISKILLSSPCASPVVKIFVRKLNSSHSYHN